MEYFPSECFITIYLSKLTNHVLILLVQYQNRLCVLYLGCTRGYLQFDMLVAIVCVRNNETCLWGTSTKHNFSRLLLAYRTSTLVIMFTKYALIEDLKINLGGMIRTQNLPQTMDYKQIWQENIKEWKRLSVDDLLDSTQDRSQCQRVFHPNYHVGQRMDGSMIMKAVD